MNPTNDFPPEIDQRRCVKCTAMKLTNYFPPESDQLRRVKCTANLT
jgi:hypothetical protein